MATTYRVERSVDGLSGWSTVASGLTVSNVTLTGQPINTTRYYRVVKVVDGSDYSISEVCKIVILSIPILTATGGQDKDRIILSWNSVSSSSYNLYKYLEESDDWYLIGNGSFLSLFDFEISNDIFYYYYVTAVASDGGETDPSNIANAKIYRGGIFTMPTARATNYQGIQFGLENTPGTMVAATKRLVDMELIQTPNIPVKTNRYQGSKGVNSTQKGQRWTSAKINGALDFNLLPYLVTLGYGAITPVLANAAYTWHWNPSSVDPLTPSHATIEQGSSKGAEKFGYSTLMDLGIKWSESDCSIEGNIFGQEQTRNATMTAQVKVTTTALANIGATSITVAALSGIIPNGYTLVFNNGAVATLTAQANAAATSLTVSALVAAIPNGSWAYLIPEVPSRACDPSAISLYYSLDGNIYTQLFDVMDGQINLNGLWKPTFRQNDAEPSFAKVVETSPQFNAQLTLEEGTEADNFMTDLDNSTKVWIGFKVMGLQLNASPLVRETIRLNMPCYVTKPDPGDKSDVFGNTFTFEQAHDYDFGAFDLTVINSRSGL